MSTAEPEEKPKHSLGNVMKRYGLIAFVYHEAIWALSWGVIYIMLRSGVDVEAALASVPEWVPGSSQLAQATVT